MQKTFYALSVIVLTAAACAPLPAARVPTPTTHSPPATKPPSTASAKSSIVSRPFPQHVAYAQCSILPDHRTQQQLDGDVGAFYDHWKQTYLVEAGTGDNGQAIYRVAYGKQPPQKARTVSEGQGYGMLILPVMAGYDPEAQHLFDSLWRFARMHPSEIDPRLMDWDVPDRSTGNNSAFDGDADMALGLLLADAQWGSGGAINYQKEAEVLINGILESTIGSDSRLPMLGDWTDADGLDFNQYTPRSSDFMLSNFRAFGSASADPVWNAVVSRCQEVMLQLQQHASPDTGLLPDFIRIERGTQNPHPAAPHFLEGPNDGAYAYNAGRVPWRVGLDALLANDPISRDIVQKMSRWAETETGGSPADLRAGYDLQGNPLPDSDYFTSFFAAPFGVAAMASPDQQDWLNAVYDAVYLTRENYYEDSVTLLCLLVMSGNFWIP